MDAMCGQLWIEVSHTIITDGEYELYGFPLRSSGVYSNFKMTIQDSKVSCIYNLVITTIKIIFRVCN